MKLPFLIRADHFISWTGISLFCFELLAFSQEIVTIKKEPEKVFSVQHQGQILDVRLGQCFVLILSNPGSGGYMVRDPEFDSQILNLEKMEKKPPSDPTRGGDFGRFQWTFRATREGFSMLIVRAFRPWQKDEDPTVIFEASVQVTQDSF